MDSTIQERTIGREGGRNMERLTLSEAAERLGISTEAVRKRVHRGTLGHTKGADGRVHVFLPSANEKRLLLDLAQASAILTVIASATYVLGLFAVWIPIVTTYTHDLTTGWYAASLVGRNVVIAQGINLLLLPPITLYLVYEIVLLIGFYMGRRFRQKEELAARRNERRYTYVIAVALLLGWFYIFILSKAGGVSALKEAFAGAWLASPRIWIGVALIVGSFFLLVVLEAIWDAVWETPPSAHVGSSNIFGIEDNFFDIKDFWQAYGSLMKHRYSGDKARDNLKGAVLISTLYFFVILSTIIWFHKPALPSIVLSKEERTVEGRLLAHTDGFWYVVNAERGLIAIPDDKVKHVQAPPGRE